MTSRGEGLGAGGEGKTPKVTHPVADPRQRQAWRRYFKKLRQQQENKDKKSA